MFKQSALAIAVALALTACGSSDSGDSSGVTTASGQFKDSNTTGISYVSGGQSGVTDTDGGFTYEVGQTTTFSIGGVTLGTTDGKSVITPIDLISGGTSSSAEVQNIVRFLMMLDDNGNPSDGINISSAVQNIASSWSPVSFSTTDLPTDLIDIISDAVSADNGIHALPSASAAQSHLESTLLCSYSGAYKGTFSGDDSGTFGFLVDAINGGVSGIAYSVPDDEYITLSGTEAISYDQNSTFVSGNTNTGSTFNGQFSSVNDVSGSWQNSTEPSSGSFSGERVGGVLSATHRFTGTISGDSIGLVSLDVDASNNITGVTYNVPDDTMSTLSGSVSGTTLTAVTSAGTTVTGTLNTSTGTLSGTWNHPTEGESGIFSGSGCKLN